MNSYLRSCVTILHIKLLFDRFGRRCTTCFEKLSSSENGLFRHNDLIAHLNVSKQRLLFPQESERAKQQKLEEEVRRLEQRLREEREENARRMEQLKDVEALRRREQALAAQVVRLKAELERSQRTWEKKFAILRQSLHALKDESYIRQAMQRQAAQLHQAAVMYAADVPVGLLPRPVLAGDDADTEPLPPTATRGARGQDAFSYTLSVPQTAQTVGGAFDEDQIISDAEEQLPAGTQPLPSPPAQRKMPVA